MCKVPHYVRDVNQPDNVSSVICLLLVKTTFTLVSYFTLAIPTYVRYGQVIGQCVNAPIHTFGIGHNFTKKGGEIISPPLNACEHKSLSPFPSPCSIPFSALLFNYSFLSPPYVPPSSPHSITSPHLSLILISFFLSLDGTTEFRPPKTNDNNNSLKCRRESGLLYYCPLSLSPPASFFLLFPVLLPR